MILGIDIGATKTQIGYLKGDKLLKSASIKTDKNPEIFLLNLHRLIEEFLNYRNYELKDISKIGIGAPGPLEPISGVFGKLPNLPDWEGLSIKRIVEEYYNVPVYIQNDANVAALGEAIYGGGKGLNSVCYITISTGIGAGFVINNRIIKGKNNLAGEIWALKVGNLGRKDILLNACSGPGIVKNVKKLISQGFHSSLKSLSEIEPSDIFNHAFNGDYVAKRVLKNAWKNMGLAIEMILLTLDPDIVLLGGGLCFDERYMVEPIRKRISKNAFLEPHKKTAIRRANLWNEAVIYGAIALADYSKPTD